MATHPQNPHAPTTTAAPWSTPPLTLRVAPAAEAAPTDWVERDEASDVPARARQIEIGDPRWSLAVATHQRMTGTMLRPDDRAALIRMGRTMGLDAFAANLVIAVVQDQARRGRGPAGGIDQLLMILPNPRGEGHGGRRAWWIAGLCVAAVVAEAAVIWLMW